MRRRVSNTIRKTCPFTHAWLTRPSFPRPMNPRPIPTPPVNLPANGAIYQAQTFRPVFEDRRGRMVGDIINVVITERTTANKNGTSSATRTGGVGIGIPGPLQGRFGARVATETDNNYADSAAQTASTRSGSAKLGNTRPVPHGWTAFHEPFAHERAAPTASGPASGATVASCLIQNEALRWAKAVASAGTRP